MKSKEARGILGKFPHYSQSGIFYFRSPANENYNINQVVQGLEEELLFYKEKTVVDQKSYEDAYRKHTKMQEAYHVAKNINERFD